MNQVQVPQPAQNRAEENERFLQVLDQFEKVFRAYTTSEAEAKRSKIELGKDLWILGDAISLVKEGVTPNKAQRLVNLLVSVSTESKTRLEIDAIVKEFPVAVVKRYSKNLFDEKTAFATFKREYLKKDETARKDYYNELMGLGIAPTEQRLSQWLWSDAGPGESDASSEKPLRFPMLDFYLLLLQSYEQKPPQKQRKQKFSELFIQRLVQFFSISIELACKSSTFEDFDAKMKALTSFEPKRVALPDSAKK